MEANQMLTKALQIDPLSVDALVARGCLFANIENHRKALDNFQQALDLDPTHKNARMYMLTTLIEHGRM